MMRNFQFPTASSHALADRKWWRWTVTCGHCPNKYLQIRLKNKVDRVLYIQKRKKKSLKKRPTKELMQEKQSITPLVKLLSWLICRQNQTHGCIKFCKSNTITQKREIVTRNFLALGLSVIAIGGGGACRLKKNDFFGWIVNGDNRFSWIFSNVNHVILAPAEERGDFEAYRGNWEPRANH